MEGTSSMLEQCSIGSSLNDSCHKKNLSRGVAGFFSANELSQEDRKLLGWRSGLTIADESTICFHHHKVYLDRYESLQKFCCDPFHCHKRHITSELYINKYISIHCRFFFK